MSDAGGMELRRRCIFVDLSSDNEQFTQACCRSPKKNLTTDIRRTGKILTEGKDLKYWIRTPFAVDTLKMKSEIEKEDLRSHLDEDLSDGRKAGDFASRYPLEVRKRQKLEIIYLVACLFGSLAIFVVVLVWTYTQGNSWYHESKPDHGGPLIHDLLWGNLFYATLTFFAASAGASLHVLRSVFASIHSNVWHYDRSMWRMVFPLLGGGIGVMVFGMSHLAFLSPFRDDILARGRHCLGFGMIVGFFSEPVLRYLALTTGDFLFKSVSKAPQEKKEEPESGSK